jgi:RNA polymerase sigma factor (sigma-70 family)
MQTLQAAVIAEPTIDRVQEVHLGNQVVAWQEAIRNGNDDPKIAHKGQKAAVALAQANQRYLPEIIKNYFNYPTVEIDELWTTGFLALVQAAKSYNPKKGYFWHYAKWTVFGEIQDLLRKTYSIILPKSKFAEAKKNEALKEMLACAPLNEEILNVTAEIDEDYRSDEHALLKDAISTLTPDLRHIIEKYYGIGCERMSLSAIACERGVSITTIGNHRDLAQEQIKAYLENPYPVERLAKSECIPEPDRLPEIEKLSELEKPPEPDITEESSIEVQVECPNCHVEIPAPPEGSDIYCGSCFSHYERILNGRWEAWKSAWGYAAIIFKGKRLDLPHKPEQESRRFEQRRIETLNDLARVYNDLKDKGDRFERVREDILNLWRETNLFRIFDESAMERVSVWVEEVKNRNST